MMRDLVCRVAVRWRFLLSLSVVACSALGCAGSSAFAPEPSHGFVARQVATAHGTHSYWIYRPTNHTPAQKWPVILYLHGGGERGDDGVLPTQVGLGPAVQRTLGYFPFVVVFPQCAKKGFWALPEMAQRAMEALETAIRDYNGDPERVYVTGNSMGGFGTWYLAARYPGRFAALAPICGGVRPPPWVRIPKEGRLIDLDGDPYGSLAGKIGRTPVWVFHGGQDPLVPVRESRKMVEALQRVGGLVRYTEWPGVGHESEEPTYAQPELFEWMLRQRLGQPSADAGAAK
jgi:predicted peptidase